MDFKKYGIVYGLIAIVGVLFVATRLFPNVTLENLSRQQFSGSKSTPPPEAQGSPVSAITVKIDFGDGQKSYSGISASNAYGALVEAAKQDNLEVGIKQYDFGVLVDKVGSYQNSQERVWVYYVNVQSGDVAGDKKEIKQGDVIEWKFVKP